MAYPFYTGIHMPSEYPWDAVNHPHEFNAGAVRTIVWPTSNPDTVAKNVQDWKDAGKFVIVCPTPVNNAFASITLAAWNTFIDNLLLKGVAPDAWEIGNEPAQDTGSAVGGPYWPRLRSAAAKFRTAQPTIPRILAAPFSDKGINAHYDHAIADYAANGGGLTILDDVDAWAIHLYALTPSAAQSKLISARQHVDAYAQSWANLPVHITEYGWPVYTPAGSQGPITVSCPTQATNLTAQMTYFRDHRHPQPTGHRIAGAYWYAWQDLEKLKNTPTGYYGLKKQVFTESVNSCPAGVQPKDSNGTPNPNATNGYRASKAALDAFAPSYDVVAGTPPDAVTDPAVNLLQTSAGLRGKVHPHNLATTRTFQWGTVAGPPYPNETTGAQVTGNTLQVVQFSLTNLLPGHTYHYRTRARSSAGEDYGVDQSFTTAAPPLAPSPVTGPVTSPTKKSAVLNGTVNPNGLTVTDWHFKWGTTPAMTNVTSPSGSIASGTTQVPVSAKLTGLNPGDKVYYQLVATNSAGTSVGVISSFIVATPPSITQADLTPVTLLPLAVAVEIVTRDGDTHHLSEDAVWVGDRPQRLEFSTQAGDGFADGSFELERSIDFRWPDLDLLNRVRVIGADGSIGHESRIVGLPRSVDEDGERITVQLAGLMSSAQDDPFTDIIVDRSAEGWQNASLNLRKAYMDADVVLDTDYEATADAGHLHFKGHTNKRINGNSQAVLEYYAPTGVKLRRFSYKGTEKRISPNVKPARLHADDVDTDTMGNWAEAIDLTLDGTQRGVSLQRARSILGLRMCAHVVHGDGAAGSAAPALPSVRRFRQVAVYSDHGIELQDNGDSPDGVFASDVISYLIEKHCPLLNADGVEPTSYIIEHLVFDEPTKVFDALTLINGYHLWALGAWEGGRVEFRPFDLSAPDWLVKSTDRGTTLDVLGDTIDSFANGILVSYTDLDQRDQDLHPADYADLRDDDPDNPANKAGISLTTDIEISNPVTRKDALSIGRAALAEFNRPKAPGTIRVQSGYVRDAISGVMTPSWKVRCGQTIAIQDQPFDGPRLITATHYDDSGTQDITVEQPPPGTDAVLARLDAKWAASGL